MTAARRANLQRLLAPRHIAVIGGAEAANAASRSRAEGFAGPIWGVNPRRSELGGAACFARVEDLPEAPDAVFLAVPREPAVAVVQSLEDLGAGGVVVYTAGFRELGSAGAGLEQALIAAAGDMALVGPNCFGLLDYLHGAVLWPYDHGGRRAERGAAIVSQSGMLASNLTMARRHLPFSYVISSGNQSVLGVEDYLEVLIDDPAVTGIGLYIEELRDVPRFSRAALRALAVEKPIVALKAGRSEIAARLTVTHTGSLSGSDELYQALFDRFGVVRVESPSQFLETLTLLTVAGAPRGRRLAAFTGSGGDAAMLADGAAAAGLVLPQPSPATAEILRGLLPDIATVTNPLDYTTGLWGSEEPLRAVMTAQFADGYDAALIVQDYPPKDLASDRHLYLADSRAFMAATRAAGIPAAVCSAVPENQDAEACRMLAEGEVAPLQGLDGALAALGAAAAYGEVLSRQARAAMAPLDAVPLPEPVLLRDEWQGKQALAAAGLPVPEGRLVGADDVVVAAAALGFPVALKAVDARLPHKTEAGAVRLGLESEAEVAAALAAMTEAVAPHLGNEKPGAFLVEVMAPPPVAELLVGLRRDAQFGLVLVLASGGVLVELVSDATTLLLPADVSEIEAALGRLKVARLLAGYRGRPPGDRAALVAALQALARFAGAMGEAFVELEINPLFVLEQGVVAVDVLLRQAGE